LTYNGTIDWDGSDAVLGSLPETRHLHIASYYLMHKLRPHWQSILHKAKEVGVSVSLDTNFDPAERWDGAGELFADVDILFPNEQELKSFTGESDPLAAARLLARKVPLVVAKLGANGAFAVTAQGAEERVGARTVPVADTVGAGDTFDAGFLYGYLSGKPLRQCLEMGTFCASRNVTKAGGIAGQPMLAEAQFDPAFQS
jgi:sugar/nucleoside kinase (ribokinase family)